ncbi:hypothetical protein THAOC_26153, partial [Thalassiosira oceanica]
CWIAQISAKQWGAALEEEVVIRVHAVFLLPISIGREDGGYPRFNLSTPRALVAPTHTHTAPERGRANWRPHWYTASSLTTIDQRRVTAEGPQGSEGPRGGLHLRDNPAPRPALGT